MTHFVIWLIKGTKVYWHWLLKAISQMNFQKHFEQWQYSWTKYLVFQNDYFEGKDLLESVSSGVCVKKKSVSFFFIHIFFSGVNFYKLNFTFSPMYLTLFFVTIIFSSFFCRHHLSMQQHLKLLLKVFIWKKLFIIPLTKTRFNTNSSGWSLPQMDIRPFVMIFCLLIFKQFSICVTLIRSKSIWTNFLSDFSWSSASNPFTKFKCVTSALLSLIILQSSQEVNYFINYRMCFIRLHYFCPWFCHLLEFRFSTYLPSVGKILIS